MLWPWIPDEAFWRTRSSVIAGDGRFASREQAIITLLSYIRYGSKIFTGGCTVERKILVK